MSIDISHVPRAWKLTGIIELSLHVNMILLYFSVLEAIATASGNCEMSNEMCGDCVTKFNRYASKASWSNLEEVRLSVLEHGHYRSLSNTFMSFLEHL